MAPRAPRTPPLVSLRQAAELWDQSPNTMQVLPSRYGPDSTRPFPKAVDDPDNPGQPLMNDRREKLYPGPAVKAWLDARPGGPIGRPRTGPPDYMTEIQWATLVQLADAGHAIQVRPERWRGNHQIVAKGGHQLDMKVVAMLMVEHLVDTTGDRGELRFTVTPEGKALIRENKPLAEKVRATS